jgi:hypothetical protein
VSKLDQLRALREARYAERGFVPDAETVSYAKPVTNTISVTNSVTNKTRRPAEIGKDRVARWRAANPDRYRTYMRDLMRRLRAEAKA